MRQSAGRTPTMAGGAAAAAARVRASHDLMQLWSQLHVSCVRQTFDGVVTLVGRGAKVDDANLRHRRVKGAAGLFTAVITGGTATISSRSVPFSRQYIYKRTLGCSLHVLAILSGLHEFLRSQKRHQLQSARPSRGCTRRRLHLFLRGIADPRTGTKHGYQARAKHAAGRAR